jgi:hypothetical protein
LGRVVEVVGRVAVNIADGGDIDDCARILFAKVWEDRTDHRQDTEDVYIKLVLCFFIGGYIRSLHAGACRVIPYDIDVTECLKRSFDRGVDIFLVPAEVKRVDRQIGSSKIVWDFG